MKIISVIKLFAMATLTGYIASLNGAEKIATEPFNNVAIFAETSYDITPVLEKLTALETVSYKIVGDMVYVYATGVPNHKSPYFIDTQWEKEKYVDNTSRGFHLNPNRIETQDYEFRIPLHPKESRVKRATNMGPMGIAINGVPFFNQYAAGGAALTREIRSFDQYNGHPTARGNYHYHIEPTYLTDEYGSEAFLGLLLDGFPVYGPMEKGTAVDGDTLDEYHGHFGVTADFPNGIYHYHITPDAPYINGDGFFGNPGTVSN